MRRATRNQLPRPLFKVCPKCGQPLVGTPPHDPLGHEILRVLRDANGRLVKMGLILDFIAVPAGRTTVHERVSVYESGGWVERDPNHPKSGYRITAKGRQAYHGRSEAA